MVERIRPSPRSTGTPSTLVVALRPVLGRRRMVFSPPHQGQTFGHSSSNLSRTTCRQSATWHWKSTIFMLAHAPVAR
ncbi:MAG: hypothetical protein ACK559_01800 [bacterium]